MTASNQKYLKAVYELSMKNGKVRVVDIALVLSVSKASVCNALKRLSEKGLLIHELYGDVNLTDAGGKRARTLLASYERMKTLLGEAAPPMGFEYLLSGVIS